MYEKDPTYYDILQSQCDAFGRFLGKIDKISDKRKEGYQNFLLLFKKILKDKKGVSRNKISKEVYFNLLDNLFPIVAKEWFREVINRL